MRDNIFRSKTEGHWIRHFALEGLIEVQQDWKLTLDVTDFGHFRPF